MRFSTSGLAAAALVLASSSALAADPALSCHSSKLKISAKYGSCRLSAESKAVKSSTTPDYSKCNLDKFADAETKAGGACPTTGDAPVVDERVAFHTDAIAELLAGGYPVDPYSPATGQTATFGSGDDGDLQTGATLAYQDNGDGTITDLNTGLMWEKKVGYTGGATTCTDESGSCANPHNGNNQYLWSANAAPFTQFNGAAKTIFLEQLNDRCDNDTTIPCTTDADCSVPGGACGFAGHRDWRLPNLKELTGLIDVSVSSPAPAIASAFHGASCGVSCVDITSPSCSCTAPDWYWTSSTFASTTSAAWYVIFNYGYTYTATKGLAMRVRAVRG